MQRLSKWLGFAAVLAALVLVSPASALAHGWHGGGGGAVHAAPAAGGGWHGGYGAGWRGGYGGGWHGGYGHGASPYVGPRYYGGGYVGYPGYYWGWPAAWGWSAGARVWTGSTYTPSDNYPQYPGWVWVQGRWTWTGAAWSWIPGHWAAPGS